MITSNIHLGKEISIEKDASINNVRIGDGTKIAGGVKLFGSPEHLLEVGCFSFFGMNTIVEGFNAKITIGNHVSIAPNVSIISGSGPNASLPMQKVFGNTKNSIGIGDHTWIGGNSIIMPGVYLGKYCVVGAGSFVNKSFPDYSIIGGTPAKLIRTLTESEIKTLHSND